MLKQLTKNRASRAVLAATAIAIGVVAVTATPSVAAEEGRNPDGLYIFLFDPLKIITSPFRIFNFVLRVPLAPFKLQRDEYEG